MLQIKTWQNTALKRQHFLSAAYLLQQLPQDAAKRQRMAEQVCSVMGFLENVTENSTPGRPPADVRDARGDGPLAEAAMKGYGQGVLQLLVTAGASVNAKLPGDRAPLATAAAGGCALAAGFLCDLRADINAQDNNGATALYHAAQRGHVWVVEELCKRRAAVDTPCAGATPLYIALQNRHLIVAAVLCERGANVLHTMRSGETPLSLAIVRDAKIFLRLVRYVPCQPQDGRCWVLRLGEPLGGLQRMKGRVDYVPGELAGVPRTSGEETLCRVLAVVSGCASHRREGCEAACKYREQKLCCQSYWGLFQLSRSRASALSHTPSRRLRILGLS